jgi:carboxymethylenebutenolidase
VVVISDARGRHQYYKDLSDRSAEVGLDAVAIDFFARTAPKRARLAECHRQWLTSRMGEG